MKKNLSFEEALVNIIAEVVKEILELIEEVNIEERKIEENGK